MKKLVINLTALLCFFTTAMAQSKVGVNTNTPGSTLSVNGNAAIGSNYADQAAPENGAVIEGNVGIGVLLPTQKLEVAGNIKSSSLAGNSMRMVVADFAGVLQTQALPDGTETKINAGANISIAGAGTITSPYVVANTFIEADGSTSNEIQALSIAGNDISLSNGGGTITLPAEIDGSITNEIQALSIVGNTVSLSNGGGSVSLPIPDGAETKVNAGTNISIAGAGTIASPYIITNTFTEVDGSTTNRLTFH